jgi:Cys2His2 zinc finger developmental/cell cycle regulator
MDPLSVQQYCLRWNNHQSNLLAVFEDLLHNEAFVDVTLACDSKVLKAHKLVLSACSPYFQSLLFGNPDRHPIVFLKDVKFAEMRALLEFMYRGEVSVDQDCLDSLLKVAESLRIKGLAEVSYDRRAKNFSPVDEFMPSLKASPSFLLTPLDLNLQPIKSEDIKENFLFNKISLQSPSGHFGLGPKRKRGRPRRLSSFEAVPMAFGRSGNDEEQFEVRFKQKCYFGKIFTE